MDLKAQFECKYENVTHDLLKQWIEFVEDDVPLNEDFKRFIEEICDAIDMKLKKELIFVEFGKPMITMEIRTDLSFEMKVMHENLIYPANWDNEKKASFLINVRWFISTALRTGLAGPQGEPGVKFNGNS